MKLRELLESYNSKPQDVDLYHWDYDEESATMVDLSMKGFTEAGLEEFKNVLDAEVVRVTAEGENWVSVFVKGVNHNRVAELSYAHSGNVTQEEYDRLFTMDTSGEKEDAQ
ncbi:hypothetical protein AGMMS49975_16570 [Clostridia bacterium]|nr:hypothetical protein AGMMS49975_16570 [Clostridia bacterium]